MYNLGRAYHELGLVHIAIHFYERVLNLPSCSDLVTVSTFVSYLTKRMIPLSSPTRRETQTCLMPSICGPKPRSICR